MKTNKLIIAKAKMDNDSEVWSTLVNCYQPLIEKWVRRFNIYDHDVADITQEVLCVLVVELQKFEHSGRTGAFRNWLRTITVNRIRQHWCREKRNQVVDGFDTEQALRQLADPCSELSQRWNQEHDQHIVEQLLARAELEFDEVTMKAFHRFAILNEDVNEVGKDLSISAGQIYKYKFRVLKRLREIGKSFENLGLEFDYQPQFLN